MLDMHIVVVSAHHGDDVEPDVFVHFIPPQISIGCKCQRVAFIPVHSLFGLGKHRIAAGLHLNEDKRILIGSRCLDVQIAVSALPIQV